MKLHFESSLDFQLAAIKAVTDLFRGQEVCRTTFTVARDFSGPTQDRLDDIGIGNRLRLIENDLLHNLQEVQLAAGLPVDEHLRSKDFTVEMETGTGKTYVYLRTIFELHRLYGFTKFVIVVPSVAIKEGVFKTMQITREHFEDLYPGAKGFEFFLYDSSKPGQVRNFAVSSQIQVMIVTVGAINKKEVNNLYKISEKTNDIKPIDLIVQTSPIVIVDEPQSVDGGLEGRGKEALAAMEPLCTLRYSATHLHKHHMVYRLDAIEAYQRKLVKQIEVAGMVIDGSHNRAYLRLVSVKTKAKRPVAVIEIDVQQGPKIVRKEITVTATGLDLAEETGRDIYKNLRIENFGFGKTKGEAGWIQLSGHAEVIREGESVGGVDQSQLERLMIRRVIHEHLEKERRLRSRGIKVLSLFFLKSVKQYRAIDDNGVLMPGVLGPVERIFREEFMAQVASYTDLYPQDPATLSAFVDQIQGGYFAIDKKGQVTDPELDAKGDFKNEKSREDAARAYELIMKKKEELLDQRTPLRFIFSHSALREGWDNPNVFQICNLRDMGSERERRQTIGRGLRICVDQNGQRIRDAAINTLTVIASESFEEYAAKLQTEIQEQTGLTFGVVNAALFAGIATRNPDGTLAKLGDAAGQIIQQHLIDHGYIDRNGKVLDALREAIGSGTVIIPEAYAAQKTAITNLLRAQAGKLEISDADKKRKIVRNKQIFVSPEFQALWDRIKHKTTYRVAFDNEKLITDCITQIRDEMPRIPRTRVQFFTAGITIDRSGLGTTKILESSAPYAVDEVDIPLPDVLTELQDRTQLTRKTIGRILIESDRLDDFARNPQRFIEDVAERINRTKQHALVDGIKYQRIDDAQYYAQELFPEEELVSYLKGVVATPNHGICDQVLCDSGIEEAFAAELDSNDSVKVFAKLPSSFAVPTPLGDYHPDWAVLVEQQGQERLYLVVETKSSRFAEDLRQHENDKIACGKQHFTVLAADQNNPIQFRAKITKLADIFA